MSRAPDFKLVVGEKYDPQSGEKQMTTKIGVGWKIVKDGNLIGVNIKLDRSVPPMALSSDYDLTLWRNDPKGGRSQGGSSRSAPPPPQDEFGDDDIPFVRNATLHGDDLYAGREKKPWEP